MAEVNKISSFKSFSEIKAQENDMKLKEENNLKKQETLSKIEEILDEMGLTNLSEIDEDSQKTFISKLLGREMNEGNAFVYAASKAKAEGKDEFEFNGKTDKVNIKDTRVKEGNAFGDAVRKAKEEGATEFEFEGETYKVEEAVVNEGTRGQFGKIDKKGTITSVYTHYDSYPENMLPIIKKSFKNVKAVDNIIAKGDNSGLDVDLDKKWYMVDTYGDGKLVPAFESIVTEGAVKQFDADFNDIVKDIKSGYGWIDPEYVADTWENTSDSIDFELVKGEIYKRLIAAGLLAYADENNEENAGKKVKSLKELGIKESVVTEGLSKEQKMVETFLNKIAKEFDYPIQDAAQFVIATITKMGLHESVVTEGKDDYMARFGSANINLKKGYKHHTEEELNDLYDKLGDLVKTLNVKDVTLVFESIVNETEIKSDDEFKEYAFTILKKAFEDDFDESKAGEVVDGILSKADGDYGVAVGMLTSSLG